MTDGAAVVSALARSVSAEHLAEMLLDFERGRMGMSAREMTSELRACASALIEWFEASQRSFERHGPLRR